MEILKTFFPISFGCKDKNALITLIICYVIVSVVLGAIGWVVGGIPVVGWLVGTVLSVIGLYATATLVLGILVFCKVLDK